MKVFISWSGKKSKAVGELLDEWLQCVLQALNPWMSSKDIDRGSLWFSQINNQLKDTSIGIICITSSNLNKPWILFEAGALAKGLSSNRVCTFLVDLTPADIGDPLAQFNHTLPNKEGLWSLVRTLNDSLDENQLPEKILENVFDTYWPQFQDSFKRILNETKDDTSVVKREEKDILSELLYMTRSMDKRIRNLEYNSTDKNSRYNKSKLIDRRENFSSDKKLYFKRKLLNDLKERDINNNDLEELISKYSSYLPVEYIVELINEFSDVDIMNKEFKNIG